MVRRAGHCDDMPAAYLAASVVAVPSTKPEAFGRVAVEAQAMGTPVVVSDTRRTERDKSSFRPTCQLPGAPAGKCPPGDAAALAEALSGALSLGAAARDGLAAARAPSCRRISRSIGCAPKRSRFTSGCSNAADLGRAISARPQIGPRAGRSRWRRPAVFRLRCAPERGGAPGKPRQLRP